MLERTPQPTLRAILKYAKDHSISAVKKYNRTRHQFSFSVFEKENILKELQKLNLKKLTQEADMPVKILKDNKDFIDISKCSLMMQLCHLNFHHL